MVLVIPFQVAVSANRGAAYDIVLLAHVLAAAAGLAVVATAGTYALLLRRSGSPSESVERYYRPGVNWAGRVIFLVPVLGVALVAMSNGAWSYSDVWVGVGLALWAAVAMAGEMVLWPAERRLQQWVAADPSDPSDPSDHVDRRSLCLRVAVVSAGLLALLVAATVVMVSKP